MVYFLKCSRRHVLVETARERNFVADLRFVVVDPRVRDVRLNFAFEERLDAFVEWNVLSVAKIWIWFRLTLGVGAYLCGFIPIRQALPDGLVLRGFERDFCFFESRVQRLEERQPTLKCLRSVNCGKRS